MKYVLMIVATLAGGSAEAGSCTTFNNTRWCSDGNGRSSVENSFNGHTWGSDNSGNAWQSQRFNNHEWTNKPLFDERD